jgi:hypothetical protein
MNKNAMHQPTMIVDRRGNKTWILNGKYHREDGPAFEYPNGTKIWFLHGKQHREDGPAFEHANGDKVWYLNDMWHREDGPAFERANGDKEWYLHGKYYEDVFAWARALLKMKGIKKPSEDKINNKVQQVTSSSILD